MNTPILLLSALPLLLIAYFGDNLGIRNNVLIATARCFTQLLFLGMILHPIFVMGMDMPWLVGLCKCFCFSGVTYCGAKESALGNRVLTPLLQMFLSCH